MQGILSIIFKTLCILLSYPYLSVIALTYIILGYQLQWNGIMV